MKLLNHRVILFYVTIIGTTLFSSSCVAEKGEGLPFLIYFSIILLPVFAIQITYLISKEKYILKKLKPEFQKRKNTRYRTLFIAIGAFVFSLIFVNILLPDPTFQHAHEKFKHELRAKKLNEAVYTYRTEFISNNSDNLTFLKACYPFMNNENLPDAENLPYVIQELELKGGKKMDANAYLRFGIVASIAKDNSRFYEASRAIKNQEVKGKDFLIALFNKNIKKYGTAITHLESSIQKNEMVEESLYELSILYYRIGTIDKFKELLKIDPYLNHLNPSIARRYYYHVGEWGNYYYAMLVQHFGKIDFYGLLGSILIILCWIYFLHNSNPFYSFSWTNTASLFVLSSIMTWTLAFFLYDFHDSTFQLSPKNEFLYAFFEVGLVEEFVKLLPVLIIYFTTKEFDKPYAFIYYSCISGLGFSFIENCAGYISTDTLDLIQTRGFIATLGHLIDSAFFGYILYQGQKRNIPFILSVLLGYLVAVVSHGLYDWILFINDPDFGNDYNLLYGAVFFIILFTFTHIFSRIINNTLNMSPEFSWEKLKTYKNFSSTFALLLTSIVLGEYLIIAFVHGKEVANDSLAGGFFNTLTMTLFIYVTLGNYDFFNGYESHQYFPLSISKIIFPKVANTQNHVGSKIRLLPPKKSSLTHILPRSGTLVARRCLAKDPDWYVFKADQDFNTEDSNNRYLLVKILDEDAPIEQLDKCPVEISVVKTGSSLQDVYLNLQIINYQGSAFIK